MTRLDAELVEMVRGWAPSTETELANRIGTARATRLALTYLPLLPEEYRLRTGPVEAATDICRLADLGENARGARLVRLPGDVANQLHLKTYRLGGLIALSEAVPVFENFGFRVLEELPTPLGGGAQGTIHDFLLELPAGTDLDTLIAHAGMIEEAIAAVLGGAAENDAFNQLILFAGLDPRPVAWLRAWFRYLRQTGVAYGLATVVDALRCAPHATKSLIALFAELHDPARKSRDADGQRAHFDASLQAVRGIDDDRILRLLRAVGFKPERTVRAVLFMNEENGTRGGNEYARLAAQAKETHLAAIESDGGGFTPRGFNVDADPATVAKMARWASLLAPYHAADITVGHSGTDIEPLKAAVHPKALIGYDCDSQRYFDIHHTAADTFDKVNRRELELGAGSMAALIYLLSKYGL